LASLLVLGAGYLGAALAERALGSGDQVTLADNWWATDRTQLEPLAARGARVETADIRDPKAIAPLFDRPYDRVYLLAAQASRPLSFEQPAYTEETNLVGPRLVTEALAESGSPALVYASSLHVYGPEPRGAVGPTHPYGPQRDLAHLSKVYAELLLEMEAQRHGFDLAVLRLGIVYGTGPVTHGRPESQTVVDKFRARAAAGEPLELDDGGRATIGVVHLEDAARILHSAPGGRGHAVANVAAEAVTVARIACLAEGREGGPEPSCTFETPYEYEHGLAEYLR
jgi:nucleoside-diphosphate-sugar epimerase